MEELIDMWVKAEQVKIDLEIMNFLFTTELQQHHHIPTTTNVNKNYIDNNNLNKNYIDNNNLNYIDNNNTIGINKNYMDNTINKNYMENNNTISINKNYMDNTNAINKNYVNINHINNNNNINYIDHNYINRNYIGNNSNVNKNYINNKKYVNKKNINKNYINNNNNIPKLEQINKTEQLSTNKTEQLDTYNTEQLNTNKTEQTNTHNTESITTNAISMDKVLPIKKNKNVKNLQINTKMNFNKNLVSAAEILLHKEEPYVNGRGFHRLFGIPSQTAYELYPKIREHQYQTLFFSYPLHCKLLLNPPPPKKIKRNNECSTLVNEHENKRKKM